MRHRPKFMLKHRTKTQWYWILTKANGDRLASSVGCFASKTSAKRNIQEVKKAIENAKVEVV